MPRRELGIFLLAQSFVGKNSAIEDRLGEVDPEMLLAIQEKSTLVCKMKEFRIAQENLRGHVVPGRIYSDSNSGPTVLAKIKRYHTRTRRYRIRPLIILTERGEVFPPVHRQAQRRAGLSDTLIFPRTYFDAVPQHEARHYADTESADRTEPRTRTAERAQFSVQVFGVVIGPPDLQEVLADGLQVHANTVVVDPEPNRPLIFPAGYRHRPAAATDIQNITQPHGIDGVLKKFPYENIRVSVQFGATQKLQDIVTNQLEPQLFVGIFQSAQFRQVDSAWQRQSLPLLTPFSAEPLTATELLLDPVERCAEIVLDNGPQRDRLDLDEVVGAPPLRDQLQP